jgi:hypothetical protein
MQAKYCNAIKIGIAAGALLLIVNIVSFLIIKKPVVYLPATDIATFGLAIALAIISWAIMLYAGYYVVGHSTEIIHDKKDAVAVTLTFSIIVSIITFCGQFTLLYLVPGIFNSLFGGYSTDASITPLRFFIGACGSTIALWIVTSIGGLYYLWRHSRQLSTP